MLSRSCAITGQLTRLRADGLSTLEAALAGALGSPTSPARAAGPGVWMAELGDEENLDVSAATATANRIRELLAARSSELFGFSVVLSPLQEEPDAVRAARVEKLLEGAESDDHLWIARECAALFGDAFSFETSGPLCRVVGLRRPARGRQ